MIPCQTSRRLSRPCPPRYLAAAVVGGKIYSIGRSNPTMNPNTLNAVETYDPSTDKWTALSPLPHLSAAVLNGLIYAISGLDVPSLVNGSVPSSVVEVFNPANGTWVRGTPVLPNLSSPGPGGLAQGVAAVFNGKIYAFGGGLSQANSTSEIYDPVAGTWSYLPSRPTSSTSGVGLSGDLLNGKIYTVDDGGFG